MFEGEVLWVAAFHVYSTSSLRHIFNQMRFNVVVFPNEKMDLR